MPTGTSTTTTYTDNYNLKKPGTQVNINIADLNGNMDILDEVVARNNVVISISAANSANITSSGYTISNSKITANHRVVGYYIATPGALTSDLTVTTAAGSVTVAGTLVGTTAITLYLSEFK